MRRFASHRGEGLDAKRLSSHAGLLVRLGIGMVVILFLILSSILTWTGALPTDPQDTDLETSLLPPGPAPLRWMLDWRTEEPSGEASTDIDDIFLGEATEAAEATVDNGHLLGTDELGRDMFSRVLAGSTAYLVPGFISVLVGLGLGLFLSLPRGLGAVRAVSASRTVIDAIESVPRLIAILAVVAIFGPRILVILVALGAMNAPRVARFIDSRVLVFEKAGFVEAARELGCHPAKIFFFHILYFNCLGGLVRLAVQLFADCILVETSLCYLGFGVQEPLPSWGNIVIAGGQNLVQGGFWLALPPAFLIVVVLFGLGSFAGGIELMGRPERQF